MSRVALFTPCYNKGEYILDAMKSLLAQDFGDWEHWIIENSTDGRTREIIRDSGLLADPRFFYREVCVTPEKRREYDASTWCVNSYLQQSHADIHSTWLSDDDYYRPDTLGSVVRALDDHQDWEVVMVPHTWVKTPSPGEEYPAPWYPVLTKQVTMGRGTPYPGVDCALDGGQSFYRKHCLNWITFPFFPEEHNPETMSHSDGIFMQKLANLTTFHPVDCGGYVHRVTPVSEFTR